MERRATIIGLSLGLSLVMGAPAAFATTTAQNTAWASVTGPRSLSEGKFGVYKAVFKRGVDLTAVQADWILPDGTVVPASQSSNYEIAWMPNASHVNVDGLTVRLRYKTKGSTGEPGIASSALKVTPFTVPNFEFAWVDCDASNPGGASAAPDLIDCKRRYAPMTVRLQAKLKESKGFERFAKDELVYLMEQKGISFQWTLPPAANTVTTVPGTTTTGGNTFAEGSMAQVYMAQAGKLPVSVQVVTGDKKRKFSTVLEAYSKENEKPLALTLKSAASNKFERYPVSYTIKPEISGGHPKDRSFTYSVKADGQTVAENVAKLPPVLFTQAGSHTIDVTGTSTFDSSVTNRVAVTVNENLRPVCTELVKTIDDRSHGVHIKAKCTDPDGVIRRYMWQIDGVLQKASSNNLAISMKGKTARSLVNLVVIDDSNGGSEIETWIDPFTAPQ